MSTPVSLAIDDGVATVRLDDGDTNALSHAVVAALGEAFARIARDPQVRVVVLAGREDYFSSGASREVLEDLASGRREPAELLLPRLLLDCPVPCIAAMAGHAIGGGFALGAAADMIVLAAESRYCLSFLALGITPGMGTTRLLEHVLPPSTAHELLYTGEARRGRDLGALPQVVPRGLVESRARDLAARIAGHPRTAVVALKRTLSLPRRVAFETARTHETFMHEITFATPDVVRLVAETFEKGTSK